MLLLVCSSLFARQSASLKGTVKSETGSPLEGVTVTVQQDAGTTPGSAVTDESGTFLIQSLTPGKSYTLSFSYVGYATKVLNGVDIKPGQGNSVAVALAPTNEALGEVVVVGYGTQKKVNLTGAVSQVDSRTIKDRPVANISQALQGAVPGLNVTFGDGHPGSGGSLNVRGYATINSGSNSSPLVLIDGVPGNINLINPQDVETISVLKDASAAAIYGARAAFGVVLVTTKRAKLGKMVVSYTNNFSSQTPTVSTDFNTDGYDIAMMMDEAFKRATGNTYTRYSDKDYEELKKRQTDPSLPSVVIDNRNGKDMYVYYGNTDWWHTMFRRSQPAMQHSINLSGGTEKVDFVVSGRFLEQKGMLRVNQDKYNAYNFRAKINAHITPRLTLYTNTQFSADKYTYPGWGINNNFVSITVHALPSYVPVNPDGTATYRTELNNYTIGDGIYADLLFGKSKGQQNNFQLTNTIGANYKVTDGLVLTGNYTFDLNPYSTFARRTASPWSIYPGTTSYVGNDKLTESMRLDQYHVINAYGTYDKKFGAHAVKITAGYNQELKKFKTLQGEKADLLSLDLNQLNLGTGAQATGSSASEWALLGFFGRINYDYKGRYLLEVNGRYDGTSRFPQESRFGFFPSVSAGWRISKEAFFEPLGSIFSELKLRGSYGSLGNQLTSSNYPSIPVMGSGQSNYIINDTRTQYLSVPSPISPNLTWERTVSTNIGADFALFKNRLQGSFDWYRRNTMDMLTNGKTLPSVFGAGSPQQNAADLLTKGFEASLNWRNEGQLMNRAFSWNIGAVLSDYTSIITRFDNPNKLLNNHFEGKKVGDIWGYSLDGYFVSDDEASKWPINQSFVNRTIQNSPGEWSKPRAGDIKFKDLNGDGIVNNGKNTLADPGDLRVVGNSLPRYSFGINGGASWSNFDMAVIFQGIGKQNWYPGANADKFWGPYSRAYYSFTPEDFLDKIWSEDNPNAYFPRLRSYEALNGGGSLNAPNDKYIQDLAYIRLKNLTVGYSLPAALLGKFRINRCRIYFSGENLWTATKLETNYIDPEQASAETNGRVYPFMKTFAFGLDLTF